MNKERMDRMLSDKSDVNYKNELLNFSQTNAGVEFLIDTLNPYKFILIKEKVSYVKIDTNTLYLIVDKERRQSSSTPDIMDSIFYVGSRIDSIANFKFIESKHNRKSGTKQRIGYSFVISTDTHTTGISFYGPQEQEAVKYIQTIQRN